MESHATTDAIRRGSFSLGLVAAIALAVVPGASASPPVEQKEILGWAEWIQLGESRLELQAKLDTGADTSSVHTTKIRRYRSENRTRWVEFKVVDAAGHRTIRFRKRLVRYAYIKEHEGPSQKRPVVTMEICLGSHRKRIEVSLVDRGAFDFPVLLGRNALEGHVVVDPELEFTSPPDCAEVDEK